MNNINILYYDRIEASEGIKVSEVNNLDSFKIIFKIT